MRPMKKTKPNLSSMFLNFDYLNEMELNNNLCYNEFNAFDTFNTFNVFNTFNTLKVFNGCPEHPESKEEDEIRPEKDN